MKCLCTNNFHLVFLNNSQDNCVGLMRKNVLGGQWIRYKNIRDCYECLKTCLHKKAKTAAHDPGIGCFCSSLNYSRLHLEKNETGCLHDGSRTRAKPLFKIYNLSGFTARIRFSDYVDRNSLFKAGYEVLLYKPGTVTNDSQLVKDVTHCEIVIRKRKNMVNGSCWGYLALSSITHLGKNEICLRTSASKVCRNIMVIDPVFVGEITLGYGQQGLSLKIRIDGTVFNVSYYLDGKWIRTFYMFSKYGEEVFSYCHIRWTLPADAVKLEMERRLVVYASNPISEYSSKEKVFRVTVKLSLKVSHVLLPTSGIIKTTVQGYFNHFVDLKYSWSLWDCGNATLLKEETSGPKVMIETKFSAVETLPHSCRASVIPVASDGTTGQTEFSPFLFDNIATLWYVDSPIDYLLRGDEATFGVKGWSPPPPNFVWKLNNKEISRNRTFSYRFNKTGSYNVSVFGNLSIKVIFLAFKIISVREILTTLEIVKSSSVDFAMPVTFFAITNCNVSVSYQWDFGDGKNSNTSGNMVKHRYYKPGIYTIRVVASNGVSEIETNTTIDKTGVLCPECEFETSFENGTEVEQFRSLPIHLEISTNKLFCLEPVTIAFTWTIASWAISWGEKNGSKADSIYIPPNTLGYGKYSFNVTVTVAGSSESHTRNFSSVISVVESPLYAIIRGGFSRFVKRHSEFILDATLSFDPDNPNAELRFSWSVTQGGNTTKLQNVEVIVVDPKQLKLGRSAEFIVTVWSGKRHNTTTQHVEFKDIKANLVLDCPSCDLGLLNPSKPAIIIEKCSGYCPPNEEALWRLRELRNEYGLPKLEPIYCTVTQTPRSTVNKKEMFKYSPCGMSRAYHERESVCRRLTNKTLFCKPSTMEVQLRFTRTKPHSRILEISKNYFPGKRIFTIKRIDDEISSEIVAERFFYVQTVPQDYFCNINPKEGVELEQDFELTCTDDCKVDKKVHLIYKVVYKRKEEDGSTVSNIFFQRKVPCFKFQLPSGYESTNQIFISIEHENGVAREYCPIDVSVTALNLTSSISMEYLYKRSVAVKELFPDHRYAYHGPTLYNVTLISDLLNRVPSDSKTANSFHLRSKIREILISILRRIHVSSEYISRQFASSLESCTRVSEELTNHSAVEVVEILYKLMRKRKNANEQRVELGDEFQEKILTVISRIINQTNGMRIKGYDLKIVELLNDLCEDTLKKRFMKTPLEIIKIEKNTFHLSSVKFSPYNSENINFISGETHVKIKTMGDKVLKKPYDCDLFGCGLQALTMDADPFGDDDMYQRLSPLTKFKTMDCKQIRDCEDRVKNLNILFPIKFDKSTRETAVYNLSSEESHLFTLQRDIMNVFNLELLPLGSLPNKLKLRVIIRCADVGYGYVPPYIVFTNMDCFNKTFSADSFDGCKNLNISVDINWEVEPTRSELLQRVVKYRLDLRSFSCLSKKGENGQWSEKSCTCKTENSSVFLHCRCTNLGTDYVAVAKTLSYTFKETTIESERNGNMKTVTLVLSLSFAVIAIVLLFKERRQCKRNTAIPLERIDPSHIHKYKVTVYTGHCFGAGTTAKVAAVFYGENTKSYPVELFTENREVFRRNSRDVFVVSLKDNLGEINGIHLWHDNSGSSPSWFVDKLIIKDLNNNKKWIFRCYRWLAVDKQDGKIDCQIKPFGFKSKFTFKEFRLQIGRKFMDFHIWLSLVTMPTYSLFTRAERLMCCTTLMFAYLFYNAYFCHKYKEFVLVDCLSMFNPTWIQFKVGLFTTLACLPIYLLSTAMFRCTKSFVGLQLGKTAEVTPQNTCSIRKPDTGTDSAATSGKYERLVREMNGWSEERRCRKRLDLIAAQLVKSLYEEDEFATGRTQNCSAKDTKSHVHLKMAGRCASCLAHSHRNVEDEYSSDTSGLVFSLPGPKKVRFSMFFNVLMWIGCILTSSFSALHAMEYVGSFDDVTVTCYKQSVFWSFFVSMCISQPLLAFIVAVMKMIHRRFVFSSTVVEEAAQESEEDLPIDDSMFPCFTERNFDDPLYRKLFCRKHLKPPSGKVVAKTRCKTLKRKKTVMFLRDFLIYSLLLVFLYCFNPFWKQEFVFLHNDGLKTVLNRRTNTSSLLTWWSSGPQEFVDTLTFEQNSPTVKAFRNQGLVVGNPELTMTLKYCQDVFVYQISGSLPTEPKTSCTSKVQEKAISFNKSHKGNWLSLSHSFHKEFNKYVTDVSMKFVVYWPSLDVFSVIKLSSHVEVALHVQNDISVTTAGFHVGRPSTVSIRTIYELFFTLVPVFLMIRQVFFQTTYNKRKTGFGVKIELLIIVLSIYSVVLMWIWIKYQYMMMGYLLDQRYAANVRYHLESIYNYQEVFKFSISLTLFIVLLKVCHVIGVDKLLDPHIATFTSVISSIMVPLFGLTIVLVAFAHAGVVLFGDHLKMFTTFVQAFLLNVAYLRNTGSGNLVVETPYQQMLLALYVIAFCVCMTLFYNLVKAAFCQARVNFWLTFKKKRRMPIKLYFIRKIKRVCSLLRSYFENENNKDTSKRVPMSYIFKELDEQLNDLVFRLTHLTCKDNMPAKVTDDNSSADGSDVEYVYRGERNEPPSFSSSHDDSCSSTGSSSSYVEHPNHENLPDPNSECISRRSSASGSMTTHAETAISDTSKPARRRPFERSMRAFPTPINESMSSPSYPQVLLDPFAGEDDCAKNNKNVTDFPQDRTSSGEEESVLDGNISEDTKVSCLTPNATSLNPNESGNPSITKMKHSPLTNPERPVNSYGGKYMDLNVNGDCKEKQMSSENDRPRATLNDFVTNASEDEEDPCDYFIPRRPKVRLDAFDMESPQEKSDDGDCSDNKYKTAFGLPSDGQSLEKRCRGKSDDRKGKKDFATYNEPRVSRPFQQPSFPLSINDLFSRS